MDFPHIAGLGLANILLRLRLLYRPGNEVSCEALYAAAILHLLCLPNDTTTLTHDNPRHSILHFL